MNTFFNVMNGISSNRGGQLCKGMKFMRIRGTFGVLVGRKIYFVQFSFKEPWLLPKHVPCYKPGVLDSNMYGWLFFYFGTMPVLKMNIVDTNEKEILYE